MPIYEYRCRKCGDFEVMQRITAKPLDKCPTCHAKITKLISRTSFQLKGSGWYVTDYARQAKKDGDGAEPGKAGSGDRTNAEKAEKTEKTAEKKTSGEKGKGKGKAAA